MINMKQIIYNILLPFNKKISIFKKCKLLVLVYISVILITFNSENIQMVISILLNEEFKRPLQNISKPFSFAKNYL